MTDSRPHPFGARPTSRAASLAIASLALVTLAACGDDGTEATDPAGSASSSPSSSASSTPSSPAATATSGSASASSDPSQTSGTEVPALDPLVAAAVQDALAEQFPALIPTTVPAGWTITSATYDAQGWVVQGTDETGAPVVLTQRTGKLAPLVSEVVGDGATKGDAVDLESSGLGSWTVYTAGSTTGLGRALPSTAVVVTAPDAETATELASTLITAEDSDIPEAG